MKKKLSMFLGAAMMFTLIGSTVCAAEQDTKAEAVESAEIGSAETETALGVVHTLYGDVSGVPGEDYQDVTLFKGVPYADPPLRFAYPEDPTPWEGVRACDTYSCIANQLGYFAQMRKNNEFSPDGVPEYSEDCLYLNIATPAVTGDEKLPVYVWFHGGGYTHGYSYEAEFNPEVLASKGAIVVTVGHRLNWAGFLTLPQLSEIGSRGNYGLADCIQSVKWVHENIGAFGGDPERIVVGGQSGGSSKTTYTFISPETQGMIAGTTNQSALNIFGTTMSLEDSEKATIAWMEEAGLDPNMSVEELRALDVSVFNAAADIDPFAMPVNVVIDGKYVTGNPVDYYTEPGNLEGKDMLFGSVFGESGTIVKENPDEPLTVEAFNQGLIERYGEELCKKYNVIETLGANKLNVDYLNHAVANYEALMNNRVTAKLLSDLNPEDYAAYAYTFGRVTPGAEWGWHSAELWYMFASLYIGENQRAWTAQDFETADVMSSYWANFITNGDPNGEDLPLWPDGSSMAGMFLDLNSYAVDGTQPGSIDDMLEEYIRTTKNIADYEK